MNGKLETSLIEGSARLSSLNDNIPLAVQDQVANSEDC